MEPGTAVITTQPNGGLIQVTSGDADNPPRINGVPCVFKTYTAKGVSNGLANSGQRSGAQAQQWLQNTMNELYKSYNVSDVNGNYFGYVNTHRDTWVTGKFLGATWHYKDVRDTYDAFYNVREIWCQGDYKGIDSIEGPFLRKTDSVVIKEGSMNDMWRKFSKAASDLGREAGGVPAVSISVPIGGVGSNGDKHTIIVNDFERANRPEYISSDVGSGLWSGTVLGERVLDLSNGLTVYERTNTAPGRGAASVSEKITLNVGDTITGSDIQKYFRTYAGDKVDLKAKYTILSFGEATDALNEQSWRNFNSLTKNLDVPAKYFGLTGLKFLKQD